jgi:membrane protein implicated in regulation of membrane protease activity
MEAMLEGPAFWHWWALGGLLVIVEALAPGFMLLWFGIAAGLVGLVLVVWPGLGLGVQLLLYAGLAVLSVLGWSRFQRLRPTASDHPGLNRRGAEYVGRRFDLVTPIVNGRGRIKVGDSSWPASGPDLPAGQSVEVTGIDGTVLQVRAVPAEHDPAEESRQDGQATHA